MAAASSTASDTDDIGPHGPIRTCIGCRQRAAATALLRVVVAPDANDGHSSISPSVVPDPRRRLPGRGAWVHPVQGCVELAQRRRAFARALRVSGQLDPAAVLEYVARRSPALEGQAGHRAETRRSETNNG